MASYTCAWTQRTSIKSSDGTTTKLQWWRKSHVNWLEAPISLIRLCIVLDYESSLMTTFNTPWDNTSLFAPLRPGPCTVPTNNTPDTQLLWWCDWNHRWCHCPSWCLHKVIEVACEHSLVFNGGKCTVKQPSVTFFICVSDKDVAHPDPAMVTVVHNMPPRDTNTALEVPQHSHIPITICAFTFILHFASLWIAEERQKAFDTIECPVYTDTTLW